MLNFQLLIEKHHPEFAKQYQRTARIIGKFLGFLFYERRFQQFEHMYPHLQGFDFVEAVLRYFDFDLKLSEKERSRIPASGKIVIAANHPIGSLDGLALLHLLRQVRPDVKVIANEMLLAIPALENVLLPVDNMGGATPKDNLRNIKAHLANEGALIIFPAGEVSRFGPKGVRDGKWQPGFIKIAAGAKAPVLPILVKARNSIFFYSLSFIAKPLSTAWLIREMFKHHHNTVEARVGRPVPFEMYTGSQFKARHVAKLFRKHVYALDKGDKKQFFSTVETLAQPESPLFLERELARSELLAETPDGKAVYLTTLAQSPCVMRELGRLREMTFRLIGEGTQMPRDIDRFDAYYQQLVLWDKTAKEIVGGYRVADTREIMQTWGPDALYTQTLFTFGPIMRGLLNEGLELGRSFIQPKYQSKHALDYLWVGIGAYVARKPHCRYLFGPASISKLYGEGAIKEIAQFYLQHYNPMSLDVLPKTPFDTGLTDPTPQTDFTEDDIKERSKTLRGQLAERGLPIPTLFKHYAQVADPRGVTFTAFNIDADFGDCVDAFVCVDLHHLKPKKRQRYIPQHTQSVDAA